MNISSFNFSKTFASKQVGEVWKPKRQGYMVGRDVNSLTQTSPILQTDRDVIVARGEDTRFTSKEIFNTARDLAANGWKVKNYRLAKVKMEGDSEVGDTNVLQKTATRAVTFDGAVMRVHEVDGAGAIGEVLGEQLVTADTRLVWDKNGDFSFKTGSDALSVDGRLKAESANEVLLRVSGRDVEAGTGSIVLNLSDKKGTFSGGNGVTYLGSYGMGMTVKGGKNETTYAGYFNGADLTETEGRGNFAGVFENLLIEGGNQGNIFSGYFANTTVNGGDGENTFKGMFLAGTTLNGGEGADRFIGRFIDAVLNGGAGDDIFGLGKELSSPGLVKREQDDLTYEGIESDFINSEINGGDGDDALNSAVWGGTIDLGEGNDSARGMFSEASVTMGDGDDTVAAMYSDSSQFDTGIGSDSVELATAMVSSVITSEGTNKVTLGRNTDGSLIADGSNLGGDAGLVTTSFSTPEQYWQRLAGIRFGEVEANSVNAAVGDNIIRMQNGEATQVVRAGDMAEEEKEETAAPEENGGEKKAAQDGEPQAEAGTETAARPEAAVSVPSVAGMLETANSAAAKADKTAAEQRKVNYAMERYSRVSGSEPGRVGGTGAVVSTGTGEDAVLGYAWRSRKEIEEKDPDFIRFFRRRHDGYKTGVISWP